jgi:hypothetical protein
MDAFGFFYALSLWELLFFERKQNFLSGPELLLQKD